MQPAQPVNQYAIAVLDSLQQLGQHYFIEGRLEEARSVLERGIELVGAASIPDSYLQYLLAYGHILLWQSSLMTGDYSRPLALLQDVVAQAETLGNDPIRARAYDEQGFCLYQSALTGSRNFQAAADYFQRSLVLWEQSADVGGVCTARFHVGLIAERAGRFEEAVAHFTWVHTTARDHSLPGQQAEASRHLGFAAMRAADYEQALAAFQEALALTEAHGSRLFLPFASLSLGEVHHAQRQYAETQRYYERALQQAANAGIKRATVQILYSLGELAEEQEQRQKAREYFTEAQHIAQTIQFQLGIEMTSAKLQHFS
jgi:tetratricopeptide (TPR) repeat protein